MWPVCKRCRTATITCEVRFLPSLLPTAITSNS
jgi:hypothetical protein